MAFECQIVHAIAGRTRLRLPALSQDPGAATQIVAYLYEQPGVVTVSVTPACDSMVVYTEPDRWTAATLGQCITTLSPEMLRAYHRQRPEVGPQSATPESSWLAVSLASLAVAASLLSEPFLPLFVPLFVGAAWPLLTRAATAFTQRQGVTTAVVDATATTLLVWQGQWLPAAFLLCLEHLSATLGQVAQSRAAQGMAETLTPVQRTWWQQQDVAALGQTQVQDNDGHWATAMRPGRTALVAAIGLASGDAGQAAAVLVVGHSTGMQKIAPLTVLTTMAQAARHGVLITSGRQLEALARVNALVFDSTLPLTQGTPEVVRVISYRHQFSSDRILALAAALQQSNPHPVAQAITWEAAARSLELPELTSIGARQGLNVAAFLEELAISVGTDHCLEQQGIALTQRAQRDVQRLTERSSRALYVVLDGRLCGLVAYTDPLRPDLAETMQAFQDQGIHDMVVLAEPPSQETWPAQPSLTAVRFDPAGSPEEKVAALRRLHAAGHTVAVLSDGSNVELWAEAAVRIVLQDDLDPGLVPHVLGSPTALAQVPRTIGMARETMGSIQRQWHLMTVVNTLALVLACTGGIGPLGALALSKEMPLMALGRVLYKR